MCQPATDFVKMAKFHRDVQNAMMLPQWIAYVDKDDVSCYILWGEKQVFLDLRHRPGVYFVRIVHTDYNEYTLKLID